MSGINLTAGEVARYYSERFPELLQKGREWRCPCKIHGGVRDSFSVNSDTGFAKCHSTCDRGWDVISLEMELGRCDFKTAKAEVFRIIGRSDAKPKRRVFGPIVATYDYTDEQGKLLFQAVRHDPKDFHQRRPNGRGGWIDNIQEVRRVVYRLARVIQAEVVYIVEGERDVQSLEGLGFTATCNPMGAGKWSEEYSSFFIGKDVFICPDNDEPGRLHAEQVAVSIVAGTRSTRILTVPVGKDVSDWIAAGATEESIIRASQSAPLWKAAVSDGVRRRDLILTEKGTPKAVLANAITVLSSLDGVLAYDEFALKTLIQKPVPWSAGLSCRDWTSHDDLLATEWLQHKGVLVSPDVTGQAVEAVAQLNRIHPPKDYFTRVKWDGRSRISTWLRDYAGVADSPYSREVGKRWLISAVARIFKPGCKADHVLILEDEQGKRKSTLVQKLVPRPEFFTDEIAELGSKDSAIQMRGVMIIEIAELDSMTRGEISKVKAFITRTTDRYRPPYAKRVVEVPRSCVFVGTVNLDNYLRDETGARRFWPVRCNGIDVDGMLLVREQLWAEAKARFDAGESWWLESRELEADAAAETAERYLADPWDQRVIAFAEVRQTVTVEEVLGTALNIELGRWSQVDSNRVARALKANGWERYQQRSAEGREWRYRRKLDVNGYRPTPLSPEFADGLVTN